MILSQKFYHSISSTYVLRGRFIEYLNCETYHFILFVQGSSPLPPPGPTTPEKGPHMYWRVTFVRSLSGHVYVADAAIIIIRTINQKGKRDTSMSAGGCGITQHLSSPVENCR
ncbi:hypothetical protein NC652_009454 [Populus alba x Populus x berolinensis]|nr:hypothetical protein NC652_009454 [Populus alba x Populus x berolinensis]